MSKLTIPLPVRCPFPQPPTPPSQLPLGTVWLVLGDGFSSIGLLYNGKKMIITIMLISIEISRLTLLFITFGY